VFRGLFGKKSDRPTPPKGQIELICPECGAAQYESRLVVSTFCKRCGVHLSVNRGKVSASTATRAGWAGKNHLWDQATPSESKEASSGGASKTKETEVAANQKDSPLHPSVETGEEENSWLQIPPSSEEVEEGGFGVFLKQQAAGLATPATAPAAQEPTEPSQRPENAETLSVPPPVEPAGQETAAKPRAQQPHAQRGAAGHLRRSQSYSLRLAPAPSPEPMSVTTLQRMKEQGIYRNAYFKDVDCFECRHQFKVGKSSRSTNCPQCGAPISMEEVEINMNSTQKVKTRGDVLIRKRGYLSTDQVLCRDLRCQGVLEGDVQATGAVFFRTTGTFLGEIRCRRFVVEKGSQIVFMKPIYAEEVCIQAKITATIFCTGQLVIATGGAVNGDVTARSVSIEPGGELNGAMNIVRGQPDVLKTAES
jgi:cytoskeletal protein CcmA (bactofilin family)